ncbi:MAG: hypothetical protein IJJ00_07395 [Erysipelotrichaceae bacterium]|nr:hypothetical protein [Erysipelotrichaceae bacterium]
MKKEEILKRLDEFPYDREGYWLITGAAMVLYGMKEETHDIDLGCSRELADLLEKDGHLYKITDEGKRWFRFDDDIEILEGWLKDSTRYLEGYQVITVKGLLEMKEELGREKDLRDIELIKDYMKDHGEENDN